MTHQLELHHEKVSFLGLIDSWAIFPKKSEKDQKTFKEMLERFYNLFQNQYINNIVPKPQPLIKLHWQRLQLRLQYKAKKIQTVITLFKAKKLLKTHTNIQDIYNHWQRYSIHSINRYMIPGDHQTMLASNNAKNIAKCLLASLKRS